MKTIYLYILFFIGISLPAFTAGQTTLDEGFTTIRVVEIDEPGSIVKCLPVGVELHAPDDPQREAIVMKAGNDISVNGQISIIASSTEIEKLKTRIESMLGNTYQIEYINSPEWGIEVKAHGLTVARRGFSEGATDGWSFLAMIPAALASPAVSLDFSGEIRCRTRKPSTGTLRRTRTVTVTDFKTTNTDGSSLHSESVASMTERRGNEKRVSGGAASSTWPLAGHWEKIITGTP